MLQSLNIDTYDSADYIISFRLSFSVHSLLISMVFRCMMKDLTLSGPFHERHAAISCD